MKASQKLILAGLLTLVAGGIAGLILTGGSASPEAPSKAKKGQRAPSAEHGPPIHQEFLETAQKLALLAADRDEQELARDAVRLADHEVDLAFADALRTANQQTGPQSEETRALNERVGQKGAEVKASAEKVKQLTARAATAKESDQENLREQVEIAQAELDLEQDELADAKEDLARSGGDAHSRFQRLFEEHEAIEHAAAAAPAGSVPASPQSAFSPGSLVARCYNWSTLRDTQAQMLQAQQDASSEAAALARDHDALEQRLQQQRSQSQATSALQVGQTPNGANSKQAAAVEVASLHRLADSQKNLADLDTRVQDMRDLSAAYGQWGALVQRRQRAFLHAVIKSALWIVLAVLLVLLAERLVDRLFARVSLERRHQITLRAIVRFTVQTLAVLMVVFVIFGTPGQVSTILGLAGAGLTVALKDFIVSFFGWFVLMGRHGIRVGDWVEINGVRGEVIEVGLLRTVVLETGNWAATGLPTGRQVAFSNSFAVEGYYFNFTTSGQWLWDEIQVLLPWAVDPYPIIETISDIVAKETERNAQMAEQELQRVTRRYGVRVASAAPAVSLRSTEQGVEAIVRYITRARERSEVRSRLNHAVVKLIHPERAVKALAEALPGSSGGAAGETSPVQTPDP